VTRAQAITTLRELLRDTTYHRSDTLTRWGEAEVIRVLTYSRTMVYEYLLQHAQEADFARLPQWSRPGRVTISRMIKTATGTHNTAVPADFYQLICGTDATGNYIPREPMVRAEAMYSQGAPCIWVRDGKFKGTAITAVYYSVPAQVFLNDGTAFTEFSDAFYNTVILYATMELLHSEKRHADRFKFIERLFQRSLGSIR
jgi:hypothetical protein